MSHYTQNHQQKGKIMAKKEENIYCVLTDSFPTREQKKVKQNAGKITGGGGSFLVGDIWLVSLNYNTPHDDIHTEERYIILSLEKNYKPRFKSFPPVKIIVKKEKGGELIEEITLYVFFERPRLTL